MRDPNQEQTGESEAFVEPFDGVRVAVSSRLSEGPTGPLDSETAIATMPQVDGVAADSSVRCATFPIGSDDAAASSRSRAFGRRFLRDLGRGIVIVFLLHIFVVQISVVRGLSMEPCLRDGDRLIVDRLSYAVSDVSRYDVVVLRNPRDTSVDYVKRIVGLPGERISIRDGVVSIDDRSLLDSPELVDDHAEMAEVIVPEGHFFVLGDNRPVSCDSREFGLVRGALLKGKVRLRFWPLDRIDLF